MTRTFSRKSGSGLWSHRRMRWGRKSSARRMLPISLWLMRQPVFRLRHSPSEVYVQMSRSAISGGWSHAIIISSQRISTGIDSGRPLRWLSSRAARALHAAKRLRHLRTVFSVKPRVRAISALLCPAAAASTMLARSTRRRGAVALRANLSNLARIGGAMWILEAIERLICPLRFAGDHDIQTRYELSAGGTSAPFSARPQADELQELVDIDRLGKVVRRARDDALVPILLEGLGGDGDDRQRLVGRVLADRLHGLVAVHLRHHDVQQHQVHVGVALQGGDAVLAVLRVEHLEPVALEHAGEREDVAHRSEEHTSELQ